MLADRRRRECRVDAPCGSRISKWQSRIGHPAGRCHSCEGPWKQTSSPSKAQFLSAASNWKEAVKILARAATMYHPKSGEARLALGRALAATGDMENAFKELSEALLNGTRRHKNTD